VTFPNPRPEQVCDKYIPAPIYLPWSEQRARQLFHGGRVKDAFFAYLNRAESGSHDCQAVVAFMYLLGYVDCDEKFQGAIHWARISSKGGSAYGHWVLGWALLESNNYSDGLSNLFTAAGKGFSPALFSLASFALHGVLLNKNYLHARDLVTIATHLGHHGAKESYHLKCQSGEFGVWKRILSFITVPQPLRMKLVTAFDSDRTGERWLIYYRAIAFESEFRRDIKGEQVSSKLADQVEDLMRRLR
jgi:TPR repeat protein